MKTRCGNQKGQLVIEAVLIMMVSTVALIWATNQVRQGNYLAKLIGGPWIAISGMIENGVWVAPAAGEAQHPNQINRSLTLDPPT